MNYCLYNYRKLLCYAREINIANYGLLLVLCIPPNDVKENTEWCVYH